MYYGFEKLEVWKLGMDLVSDVYKIAGKFPDEEKFSLTSQIRRAAISVPLNIAEGSARRSKKEFASFVRIALGSLVEVKTCLEIAKNLGYITTSDDKLPADKIEALYFKLLALGKKLKQIKID